MFDYVRWGWVEKFVGIVVLVGTTQYFCKFRLLSFEYILKNSMRHLTPFNAHNKFLFSKYCLFMSFIYYIP